MLNDLMNFKGKIWKTGNGYVVTIPIQIMKYEGWVVGDELKVVAKKVEIKQ